MGKSIRCSQMVLAGKVTNEGNSRCGGAGHHAQALEKLSSSVGRMLLRGGACDAVPTTNSDGKATRRRARGSAMPPCLGPEEREKGEVRCKQKGKEELHIGGALTSNARLACRLLEMARSGQPATARSEPTPARPRREARSQPPHARSTRRSTTSGSVNRPFTTPRFAAGGSSSSAPATRFAVGASSSSPGGSSAAPTPRNHSGWISFFTASGNHD
ncbi:hypothetical protein ZWY2020_051249 [Hordeum vulgare]|nr:hypothetical protein ZWY2020_051249 [Hordeum vulgare]